MKIVLSPLLAALVVAAVADIVILVRWRLLTTAVQMSALAIAGSVALLGVASVPRVSDALALTLETAADASSHPGPVDVVVVLAAGRSAGPTAEQDDLVGSGYARVACGVQRFKRARARWLVMSGSASDRGGDSREADLMRVLAIEMGVPADRVVNEVASRSTYEHPVGLAKMALVRRDDVIGVVTSGWHAWRAVREFRRHFPKVVGLSCGPFYVASDNWSAYLPQAEGLSSTTRMLHEYIGAAWYSARASLAGR